MKRSFNVELSITNYSGEFSLFSDDAAWKVVNNINVKDSFGNQVSKVNIKTELLSLKQGESSIFWCEDAQGDYAKVTAI